MFNKKITVGQCKASRSFLNWGQEELAKNVGCTKKTISDFENGNTEPQNRTLRDIINALENAGIVFEANDEFLTVKLKR